MNSASAISIGPELARVLMIAYGLRKPVLLEGPSGIGKSECVLSAARNDLRINCIALDLSLLEPPDLLGLPVIENKRTMYAAPATLPSDGAGILLLEELNRAERYIRQPILQLLCARRLNDYVLPEGWSIVAAVNPADDKYEVDKLDPALLDRFLRLRVRADRDAWMAWARTAGVHPAVLGLAEVHDRMLEDISPRAWKHVSDLLHGCAGDDAPTDAILKACLSGYLPEAWVAALLASRSQPPDRDGLGPDTLLTRYAEEPALRARLAALRAKGRTDVLEQLARSVIAVLDTCDVAELAHAERFSLESLEQLIADLPGDHAERVQLAFGHNPTAISVVRVHPDSVLHDYETNGTSTLIQSWLSNHRQRHRAWAVAEGVARHMDLRADIGRLRGDVDARRNLGTLLLQLDFPHDRRFARDLDRLGIDAVVPNSEP